MKLNEIQGLYIGHDEQNNFNILIAAHDEKEAQRAANSYASDSNNDMSFTISELPSDIEKTMNLCFDCDYIITTNDNNHFQNELEQQFPEDRFWITDSELIEIFADKNILCRNKMDIKNAAEIMQQVLYEKETNTDTLYFDCARKFLNEINSESKTECYETNDIDSSNIKDEYNKPNHITGSEEYIFGTILHNMLENNLLENDFTAN